MSDIHDILKSQFGFSSFRPGQEETVQAIVDGKDVFSIMPTSRGKSLCYMLPAVMGAGTTLVISPLVSLMADQVRAARAFGIAAEQITGFTPIEEKSRIAGSLDHSQTKLLYVSPEMLITPRFLLRMQNWKIERVVLDEIHVCSTWSHTFREGYGRAASLISSMHLQTIGLTATATADTIQDCIAMTGMGKRRPLALFKQSFDRPNLFFEVRSKVAQITQFVASDVATFGKSIVYATTRSRTEILCAALRRQGIDCHYYHAGCTPEHRQLVQQKFYEGETPVIIATIAFGMGVDVPDVRAVIHVDVSKSIEDYYQGAGRAGRDGLPAWCILYYEPNDIARLRPYVGKIMDPVFRMTSWAKLIQMKNYAETNLCRRQLILDYFGESFDKCNCSHCDICAKKEKGDHV